MAVTLYKYGSIDINAGFEMECMIDSQEDIAMLQDLFVDLCCRCLDINDIQLGYDEENNPVETGIKYPVKRKFTMVCDNIKKRIFVLEYPNLYLPSEN
jgi:hypothetical protein